MTAFVSGCFDVLHAGHVEFLQQAAKFGRLHVAVCSDRTVAGIEGRQPAYTEQERAFMVGALACVHSAFVSKGRGAVDFEDELRALRPEVFVVIEDESSAAKRDLCADLGIDYRVLKRELHPGGGGGGGLRLARMTRRTVPYRIDLAGGWFDHPFVSGHGAGSVVTACIEPTMEFDDRSGLATSTRKVAVGLWNSIMPSEDYETAARILFAVENPPGKQPVAGSQDAIGIAFPGVAKSEYSGRYWPDRIIHVRDDEVLQFIDDHVRLVPLGPRRGGLDVLSNAQVDAAGVRRLAGAADRCWRALLDRDLAEFGAAVRASFEAQAAMFPNTMNDSVRQAIAGYAQASRGWKLCGAGGGGYLMLVTEKDVEHGIPVVVRR